MQDLTFFEAVLLGLIQGFTEWLPVSSSGHLVISQALLGISVPAAFDIVIMLGTIIALLIYFRQKLLSLIRGVLVLERQALDYLALILISGIATAIIGFVGKSFFKGLFSQPIIVSLLLVVTGIFLFIAARQNGTTGTVTQKKAFLIGIAQGLAVAPGISRSGSTIGMALILKVNPKEAAEFSFIIGIPAMLAASFITFFEEPTAGTEISLLLVAIISAFVAGYLSIGLFMKILQERRLVFFSYYCIITGLIFAVLTSI
mgnify:CR=1 FL=1